MVQRTIMISDYQAYLEFEYPAATSSASDETRSADISVRDERLSRFPYSVMLQLSFAELDFVNRWCWKQFGPARGECLQSYSEYPACDLDWPHGHLGVWMSHWFVKTDYNFGFNEWYFVNTAHRELFLDNVPQFNWGEHYTET